MGWFSKLAKSNTYSSGQSADPGDAIAKQTLDLCKRHVKGVHFYFSGGVIAKGEDIKFTHIVTYDIHRNFVQNYSDVITVEVTIDTAKFYSMVCEDLDNLEVYIKQQQMAEGTVLFVLGGYNTVKRYKAILMNPPKMGLADTHANKITNPDQMITTCTFQLVEKGALDIKMSTFSGLMTNTKPGEALAMILNSMSQDVTMDKGLRIEGVHMSTPDNETPTTVLVPQGTLVKDMAQFMQQQYGIYNFGIGSYLFQQHWFVYPLFNTQRFGKEKYKLAISLIDAKHDVSSGLRTYFVDKGLVTIAVTNVEGASQQKSVDQLNQGTGVAVRNNEKTYTDSVQREDNKAVVNTSQTVNTYNVIERNDNYQNIINIYNDTTSEANQISSVSGNNGQYITIEWHHGNPALLQPGMPVKLVYTTNKMKEIYGVLHEYHATYVRGTTSLHETPFINTIKMQIYAVIQ